MAWRPTQYLIEGELDNTQPGKVTGWMRFVGIRQLVTFDLRGNFHRDIRGAKIRFRQNDPPQPSNEASRYMEGFATEQTGDVGDITSGLPPQDYVEYPYIEWYSEQNGRVVLELDKDEVEVIGRPIPACESDPICRQKQAQNMARFIAGICAELQVPAVCPSLQVVSDPKFSHWVTEQGRIIGEAHSVEAGTNGMSFAFVRLFSMPEQAEYGYIDSRNLQAKNIAA